MDDLPDYANRSGDNPLVKAALIHAQFETIHPYDDGNGRAGRVLVHGYLARSGVLDGGVLPLSVVLRRDTGKSRKHPVSKLSSFVWSIADQLRGPFQQHEYGSVILPMTILRRLDAILEPHREQIAGLIEGVDSEIRRDSLVRKATGLPTRSGCRALVGSGRVVRTRLARRAPSMPTARINRATWSRPTCRPARRAAFHSFRAP